VPDSKFQPGAFVWYAPKGIGRVEETDVTPSVLFWANKKSGKTERLPLNLLTPLADYIPEAKPQGKASEADPWKRFESGVKKAPLKLVALALSASGNSGGATDIKGKLDRRAPVGPWGSWWKRTEPKLGELPANFKINGAGEDAEYILLSSISDVPADWIEPKVTPADWKKWLLAKTHEQPPGRFPTKPVANALAKWSAKTIEPALFRLITSAEELSASREPSAQAAEGWLRAVAQAALRWREVGGSDPRGYTAARVGEVLARLARIAGDRTPRDLLLQAGATDGDVDAWRRGFLAGMWESFAGDDARDLYLGAAAVLGRQARADLARETFTAAFGPDFSERRHPELDRLLDALPERERTQLLQEVIASAAADQRDGVLHYVASSRHADGAEKLPLRTMAVLALSGGRGDFATKTSMELADALAGPDIYGPEIEALLEDTAFRVEAVVDLKVSEAKEAQKSLEAELQRERQEQERLRQQVRERNAELAANREESRLEIRQDMLLAVGEVLQSVHRRNGPGESAGNVAAGLTLALRAGGAEPLGTPGETVAFDPECHTADGNVPANGRVSVIAPGVVYRGGIHGDRVLLKANVKHEAV
jgi:hypothetical protein